MSLICRIVFISASVISGQCLVHLIIAWTTAGHAILLSTEILGHQGKVRLFFFVPTLRGSQLGGRSYDWEIRSWVVAWAFFQHAKWMLVAARPDHSPDLWVSRCENKFLKSISWPGEFQGTYFTLRANSLVLVLEMKETTTFFRGRKIPRMYCILKPAAVTAYAYQLLSLKSILITSL